MNLHTCLTLLFIAALLLTGCKKDSSSDPLSDVVFSKDGVIRVECADCMIQYQVLDNKNTVEVKNSEDIRFSYVSDVELKTTINSSQQQNIRLAVFDAYGRVVSNELTTVSAGEARTASFRIKIN